MDTGAERELTIALLGAATLGCHLPASEVVRLAGRVLDREPATSARIHSTLPLAIITMIAADSVEAVDSWLAVEHRANERGTTPPTPWSISSRPSSTSGAAGSPRPASSPRRPSG
ncbi:hypothetical protein NQP46_01310 [Streptomyces albus]|nr:hypothetical protein NQP46_01310 [Streptomyces albus]